MKPTEEQVLQGVEIMRALVKRRHIGTGAIDRWLADDALSDATVYCVETMDRYFRAEGADYGVSNFVWIIEPQWYRRWVDARVRKGVRDLILSPIPDESGFDLSFLEDREPATTAAQELNPRAERLLAMLPERIRPAVETHLAFGIPQKRAAELLGISDMTVFRHARQAKQIWREALAA